MKKVLVFGGTSFIGRTFVEALLQDGNFEVTIFNRGVTNPELFPAVKKITGDRGHLADLKQVFGQQWDHIIDFSCYFPESLRQILGGINQEITSYLFISTCSVYNNQLSQDWMRDETAPIHTCTTEEAIDPAPRTYGRRKVACEKLLQESGIPYFIFRPSLVYGPYDPTDRFYYWLYQAHEKERILIPNGGGKQLSITYVKDQVEAILLAMATKNTNQIYNCISQTACSINTILKNCFLEFQKEATIVEATSAFLKEHNISQWAGIPLWIDGFDLTFSNDKIKEDLGFVPTNFKKSLSESIYYFDKLGYPKPSFGISNEKKEKLIEKLLANG